MIFIAEQQVGVNSSRGNLKQFYIIISTICAFTAMDFIHTGEFPPSWSEGLKTTENQINKNVHHGVGGGSQRKNRGYIKKIKA
jgi:hypothetical protein